MSWEAAILVRRIHKKGSIPDGTSADVLAKAVELGWLDRDANITREGLKKCRRTKPARCPICGFAECSCAEPSEFDDDITTIHNLWRYHDGVEWRYHYSKASVPECWQDEVERVRARVLSTVGDRILKVDLL